ncbi:MAG: sugar ABC transporter permease [Acidobacteriota bacterium]
MKKFFDDQKLGYFLIVPSLIVISIVALFPIIYVVWLSFHKKMLIFNISEFVGLKNYAFLINDERFWNSLFNTVYFTVISVSLEFIFGLAIALLINRKFPGRGIVRAIILIPWAIPTVVSAKIWDWIYNGDFGVLNFVLKYFHIISSSVNWLGDRYFAIHAAIFMDVWKTTPFVALIFIAGLQIIPEDLIKAARVDGANYFYIFKKIILPILKPVIMVILVFRTLDAFRVFDAIYVLTGGGPGNTTETLSIYAYKVLFQTLQFGYGSTISVVIFFSIMSISFLYIRIIGKGLREFK